MAVLKTVYTQKVDHYETLIRHEDYQHHLLPTIERLHPLAGASVVELGAGTGRLTRLLAPCVRSITAFDLSLAMLQVGAKQVQSGLFAQADNRALPVRPTSADLVIEGWSLAQMVAWERDQWPMVIDQVMAEMRRISISGGTMILLETLGTGETEPRPPAQWFADLYDTFESVYGFTREVIRTDFFFDSAEQAQQLMGFFWGEEQVRQIVTEKLIPQANGVVVPECTGLWWKRA